MFTHDEARWCRPAPVTRCRRRRSARFASILACLFAIALLPSPISSPGGAVAWAKEPPAREAAKEEAIGTDLKPGEWELALDMGDEIYPSWIVCTAPMKSEEPNEPDQLGDPYGAIGVAIRAPKAGSSFDVEVGSAKLIRPSKLKGTMPNAGTIYYVNPDLDFDYDLLVSIKQPFVELIRAKVSIDGKPAEEKTAKVTVHAINDCVYGFPDEDGEIEEVPWTYAAFVNENHPAVQELMGEAADEEGSPQTFSSYQGTPEEIEAEIASIWNLLQARGVRYSSITQSSIGDRHVESQYMRRVGEALSASSANCADGTVLLASILRRDELAVYLISVPGHMFLAVKLSEDDDEDTTLDELTPIETTMVANSTLQEAIEEGKGEFKENREGLMEALASEDGMSGEYSVVDVAKAREMGVMPISEPDAKGK